MNKHELIFEIKKCEDCLCKINVWDEGEFSNYFCLQYEEEISDENSKPDFCKLSKITLEFKEEESEVEIDVEKTCQGCARWKGRDFPVNRDGYIFGGCVITEGEERQTPRIYSCEYWINAELDLRVETALENAMPTNPKKKTGRKSRKGGALK